MADLVRLATTFVRMSTAARVTGFLTMLACLSSVACAERVDAVGVRLNSVNVTKVKLGEYPPEIVNADFRSPTRTKSADILGDDQPEQLVEMDRGRGLEIRDAQNNVLHREFTNAYLTDFGAIRASRADKFDLVLYMYPTKMQPQRQGTFEIRSVPDGRTIAAWDESPPPSRFTVAQWKNEDAIFYFRHNLLMIRSVTGEEVGRIVIDQASAFSDIFVSRIGGGFTAVVGSGDAYTHYHVVCLIDSAGNLVFEEIGNEHAYKIEVPSEQPAIDVWIGRNRWRFIANVK